MYRYLVIFKVLFSFILLSIFFPDARANSVDININPKTPIAGEVFSLVLRMSLDKSSTPSITFDPGKLEVLSKNKTRESLNTKIINGRITTKREIVYEYEMLANKAGRYRIRDFYIEIDGNSTKVKDLKFDVLGEAKRSKEIFARAEVSNMSPYIGEGVDVRYYLYFKIPVVGTEIDEYPKLNKFIKRFHNIKEKMETVEVKGEIFRRVLKYSARVYPQKLGRAYIDSLKLKVQFTSGRNRNSPFGGFGNLGFGFNTYRTKSLRSPKVEIEVKALPTTGVPKSFSGLVGEHDFNLIMNKKKFLVNEPVEIKLEVSGPGELENFDAPVLLEHDTFEQFDTNSSLNEINNRRSKKVFDYTLLARERVKLEGKDIEVSYFDPKSNKYVTRKITFPTIEVLGGNGPIASSSGSSSVDESSENKEDSPNTQIQPAKEILQRDKNLTGLLSPIFKFEALTSNLFKKVNLVLFILIGLLILLEIKTMFFSRSRSKELEKLMGIMNKKGIDYSTLYRFLNVSFSKKGKQNENNDFEHQQLSELINNSQLKDGTKKYFIDSLLAAETASFSTTSSKTPLKFDKGCFSEFIKFVEEKDGSNNAATTA
jgi:hypothetical protein